MLLVEDCFRAQYLFVNWNSVRLFYFELMSGELLMQTRSKITFKDLKNYNQLLTYTYYIFHHIRSEHFAQEPICSRDLQNSSIRERR